MCYVVPFIGAVTTSLIYHKKKNVSLWWLNLMLYGGAIFGIIDHLYNGQLFDFSGNILRDLFLGFLILAGIITFWLLMISINRKSILQYSVNGRKSSF